MEREFELLKIGRNRLLNLLDKLTEEELVEIPEGFNNNVLWNAGHIITSQQRLCYGLAGLELNVPKDYTDLYAKGSSPKNWTKTPDVAELKKLLPDTTAIQQDYKNGLFKNFKPYETSYGFMLNTIEDAIAFNNIHEALHTTVASCITRLVKKPTF